MPDDTTTMEIPAEVSAKLEEVWGSGGSDTGTESPKTEAPEESPAVEAQTAQTPGDKTEVEAPEATAVEIDPTILELASKESGLDRESLDNLIKHDKDQAKQLLDKFSEQYKDQLFQELQGLHIGQPAQQPVAPPAPAPTPATPVPSASAEALLTDEVIAKIREENGDALVDQVLLPYQAALAKVAQLESSQQKLIDQLDASRRQENKRTYDKTLSEFGPQYSEFYGPSDPTKRSEEQHKRQCQLGEIADQFLESAARQGKALDASDALKKAHCVVAADYRQVAARKEILAQLKQRANQIISKPTTPGTGGVRQTPSKETAMSTYETLAAKIGWST